MRSAERPRPDVRSLLDFVMRFPELVPDFFAPDERQFDVIVGVIADQMPFRHYLARERLKPAHMLADHEKRRGRARRGEGAQDRRGRAVVWSIVECQVDAVVARASLDRRPKEQIQAHHAVTRLYTPSTRCAIAGHAWRSATRLPSSIIVSRRC